MNLQNEILNYIDSNENNGALLVTGNWGCGKSHMIREISSEVNKGNETIIVSVSLFGIDSVEGLNKKVKESVLHTCFDNNGNDGFSGKIATWKEKGKNLTAALGEIIPVFKGVHAALSLNIYDFMNIECTVKCFHNGEMVSKKLVLVFDDFERCQMDGVDLLGIINDFAENRKIKTIVVADESKVQDPQYAEFKEKVIARTVKLASDYKQIIIAMIDVYNETATGYAVFLKCNSGILTQVFTESCRENLRVFKAYIMDFERVYASWKKTDVPEKMIPQALYAFGAIYFEVRANNYSVHERYGYVFADGDLEKKYTKLASSCLLTSFKDWIIEGRWDETLFISEIKRKFSQKTITFCEHFLSCDFWDLDYETVKKGMPDAVEMAYNGALSCQELVSLIGRTQSLKSFGIEWPCKIDWARIAQGFTIRENAIKSGRIIEPRNHSFLPPENVKQLPEIAQEVYANIERMQDRIAAWDTRQRALDYFRSPFNSDISSIRNHSIVSLDEEMVSEFINGYRKSSNSEKRDLYFALKGIVYDDGYVSKKDDMLRTLGGLNTIMQKLSALEAAEKDPFTKHVISETVKGLKGLLEEVQQRYNKKYPKENPSEG